MIAPLDDRSATIRNAPRRGSLLTTTHAYLTWRLSSDDGRTKWRCIGAIAPDALPWLACLAAAIRRKSVREALLASYDEFPGSAANRAMHSLLVASAVMGIGRRSPRIRALGVGWVGHLVVDYASHHGDAWPPFWPLSSRRWASPVSYWQSNRYGREWSAAEVSLLGIDAARDRSWLGFAAALSALIARDHGPLHRARTEPAGP